MKKLIQSRILPLALIFTFIIAAGSIGTNMLACLATPQTQSADTLWETLWESQKIQMDISM